MFDTRRTLDEIVTYFQNIDMNHIDEDILSFKLDKFNNIIEKESKKKHHNKKTINQLNIIINDLASISTTCENNNQYTIAIKMYKSLVSYFDNFSKDISNYITYVEKLSITYQTIGDYTHALEYGQEAYTKRKNILGENHPDTLISLNNLATIYNNLGNYSLAINYGHNAYAKNKEILGENNLNTLLFLSNLAIYYKCSSNYQEALKYQKEAYTKRKNILGEEHPDTLFSTNELALIYKSLGNYQDAIEYGIQTYKNNIKVFGENDLKTLLSLQNLASYYFDLGDYQNALKHEKEAYIKCKEVFGEKHLYTLNSLSGLTSIYRGLGDFNNALKFGQKAYDNNIQILGENHPTTLTSISNLAITYRYLGDYKKAINYGMEAYKKNQIVFGEEHPNTLVSLNNLVGFYMNLGDFNNALKFGQKAYDNNIQILGENHSTTLTSISNLAITYRYLGDYKKAINYGMEAYKKNQIVFGEEHPNTLVSLNNLAGFYMDLGDYENVLKYGQKAYLTRKKVLGENHLDTLVSLNLLALCYKYLGDFENALKYGQKAYLNIIQTLGENHPDTLSFIHNLASYYIELKDYQNALKYEEEAYIKCKEILGEHHPDTLNSLNGLATIYRYLENQELALYYQKEAYEKYKENFGENHPNTISNLNNLAAIYLEMNDFYNGFLYAQEAYHKSQEVLGYAHPTALTSLYNLAASFRNFNDHESEHNCLKMYLIDYIDSLHNVSLINDKNALRHYLSNIQNVYKNFIKCKFTYAINTNYDIDLLLKYKNIIFDIEYIKNNNGEIDASLYYNVTVKNVQSILKPTQAILDFYEYDNGLLLILITSSNCNLYLSIEINQNILNSIVKDLDIQHIYICPDGDLYNTSFEELLPGYDISYLSSPKSLLWQNDDGTTDTSVSVVCPDFDVVKQKIFEDDKEDDHTRGKVMNHLYGGFIEEKYLKNKLKDLKSYERNTANHDNFLSIKKPRILHISTHGGYLDDIITDNPMEKGILYLSGYNDIQKGNIIDDKYDKGYVSANEIQFMDLKGTDLVVLSACSTAAGTSLPGEGVYGLRRAFELAGAKTLLMTQSAIDDFNTAIFIKIYFEKYNGHNAYEAMKETKKYLLDYDDNGIQNGIHELEMLKEDFIDVFSQDDHQMKKISMKQIIRIIDMKIKISKNNNALMKDSKNKETWSAFIIQGRI